MKLKIYIGKDYENEIIAILISDDLAKAQVAFQAMQANVHNIEEIDLTHMPLSTTNTFFIMSSREVSSYDLPKNKQIRIYKRGL